MGVAIGAAALVLLGALSEKLSRLVEGGRDFASGQITVAGGRPLRFVLHEPRGGPYAPFYSGALTRTRTAAWVYPLLPLALAVDAATDPVLLFFAPAVMVLGD